MYNYYQEHQGSKPHVCIQKLPDRGTAFYHQHFTATGAA
jgi:hypothetical protein